MNCAMSLVGQIFPNSARRRGLYGYFIWLDRSLVQNRQVEWVVGVGLGGQRLYIAPALDLVVVVNARLYKANLKAPFLRQS